MLDNGSPRWRTMPRYFPLWLSEWGGFLSRGEKKDEAYVDQDFGSGKLHLQLERSSDLLQYETNNH